MVNSIEERGRVRGLRELVRKQLEKKFGSLDADVRERLDSLPVEKIEEIAVAYADAKSLGELGLMGS
jgi:hypothetical protein